jgi:hypothetical protein
MLGPNWRLREVNTQNQNVTSTVKAVPFRIGTDGQEVRGSEVTLLNAVSVSASGGTQVSSDQTNTGSTPWTGLYITASFAAAASTNSLGAVSLFLDRSTDGGTTWPDAARGIPIGGIRITAGMGTSTYVQNFEFV